MKFQLYQVNAAANDFNISLIQIKPIYICPQKIQTTRQYLIAEVYKRFHLISIYNDREWNQVN